MLPSLFIAHGAPLLAIQSNAYTDFLKQLASELPRPKAIVLFSAHWESPVQRVSTAPEYDTIYDFGGFPPEMYQIKYPAKGDLALSDKIAALLEHGQVALRPDGARGLDHGAWVVLRLLYPHADIPVVAMSVNPQLTPQEQYQVGLALSSLREEDVLIIGSGGTVHNLARLNWGGQTAEPWAVAFDDWLKENLEAWDLNTLFHYDTLAPNASLAVPPRGREHFIPLFYAMGAANGAGAATLLHRSYEYGSLSHSVWRFGA